MEKEMKDIENKDKEYLLSTSTIATKLSQTSTSGTPTSRGNDDYDEKDFKSNEEESKRLVGRKRCCIITLVIFALLIITIVGIAVGLLHSPSSPSRPSDNDGFNMSQIDTGNQNNIHSNENEGLILPPPLITTRPPVQAQVTVTPTEAPTTSSPTSAPVDYCPQQSDHGASFQFNDEFNTPILVSSNTFTFGVDIDLQQFRTCDTKYQDTVDVRGGSNNNNSSSYGGRGIWYVLDGPGAVVIASTCSFFYPANFDTQLSIFTSMSPTCRDGLACVTMDDNSCEFSNASKTSWFAEQGRTYYILIHGAGLEEYGDFTLELSLAPIGTCDAAITLPVAQREQQQQQEPLIGVLLGATVSIDPCSAGVVGRGGEIWYQVSVPTGHWLVASTCHDVNEFPPRLALYMGDCQNLQCATPMHYQQDSDCGLGTSITWYAESDETYYILVYKTNYLPGVTFGITVEELEPPMNDNCTNAIELQPDGSIVYGSTLTATNIRSEAEYLGCNIEFSHPGVWYSVVGTGTTLTASTCDSATNFDTRITVYTTTTDTEEDGGQASESCTNGLSCVTDNDQWCGYQSSVDWSSIQGIIYYILVHGSEGGIAPSIGRFGLAVYEFTPTINNDCNNAIGPLQVDSRLIMYGSTLTASVDQMSSLCANGIANVAPGVWYTVVGTGRGIHASTCGAETDFDTRITIYEYTGSSTCEDDDSMQCLITNDNGCGFQSQVYWPSIEGQLYYILVNGNFFSSFGNFELKVSPYNPSTIHDFCENAVNARIGVLNVGSTTNATYDGAKTCVVPNTAPGVWYRIVGTGNRMIASTCHIVTDYDTRISVFAGSCRNLECIAGNDDGIDDNSDNDDCGSSGSSRVSWLSNSGESYSILVHGFGARSGVFGLTIEDEAPSLSNDFCVGASLLWENSDFSDEAGALFLQRQGTNIDATFDNVPVCGDVTENGRGVWFRGTARYNSSLLVVSTCNNDTSFDTQLSVFRGNCGSLECVGGNNNDPRCDNNKGSSVTFYLPENEETFFVLVHGASADDFGQFSLLVLERSSPVVANDYCTDAIQIPVIVTARTNNAEPASPSIIVATTTTTTNKNFSVSGSTIGASYDNVGTCVVPNTSPGVWYLVYGTGHVLTATTCHEETDFDTRISVFDTDAQIGTYDCAGSLMCITGNDDTSVAKTVTSSEAVETSQGQQQDTALEGGEKTCGASSTASWFSASGVTYYILVHGFGAHVGDFALSVEDILYIDL